MTQTQTQTQLDDRLPVREQFELFAWLCAFSGSFYFTHYIATFQFLDVGAGLHPLSYVFLSVAFLLLNVRRYNLLPKVLRQWEPKLTVGFAVVLAVFVCARLLEQALGYPVSALTWIAGDAYEATAYASWGTALGILLLFSMSSFCQKPAPKVLRLTSYFMFWSIVFLCVHQLVNWSGLAQFDFILPGVSAQSAASLLMLAGVVLPRSAIWETLFDARTYRSSLIIAAALIALVASVFLEAALYAHNELAELMSAITIVILFFLAPALQRRELRALATAGRLTPTGGLIVSPRPSVMRPLPHIQRRGLAKLFYDVNFVKPPKIQDAVHAVVVFAVAIGSIALSRTEGSSIALIWPVNPMIGYWILINPVARWARVVTFAYVALLAANIAMGNPLAASALLTGVNLCEALLIVLVLRSVLQLYVKQRLVQIQDLTVQKLLLGIATASVVLLGSSSLGGFTVSYLFGGSVVSHSWTWLYGTGLGWFAIIPIALGFLMEQHWGYPKLKGGLTWFWQTAPVIWLVFGLFVEDIFQIRGLFAIPYAISTLFGLVFRSLWQAGVHLLVLTLLISAGLHSYGHVTDAKPFVLLFVAIILSLRVQISFLARKQQERTVRERDLVANEGPSTIVTLDTAGRVVTCTERLVQFTGQPREALMGQSLMDVLGVESPCPSVPPEGVSGWQTSVPRNDKLLGIELHTQRTEDPTMPFTYICSIRDRSEAILAERARVAQIERSQSTLITQDEDWRIVHCSDAWCDVMGYSREETIGKDLHEFFANETTRAHGKNIRGSAPSPSITDIIDDMTNYELRTKSGDIRLCKIRGIYTGYQPDVITTTLQDVTELVAQQKRNASLLDLSTTLLDNSPGIILSQDEDWNIITCSEAWVIQLGYSKEETLGRDLLEFMHPDERDANRIYREGIRELEKNEQVAGNTVRFVTKGGEVRDFELKSVPTAFDGHWRNVVSMVDITELMNAQDTLKQLVERDELTGLLTRRGLKGRVDHDNRAHDSAIFILDIDHFKSVNDSYGHQAGDTLLHAIGQTLERLTQDGGFAARLGGEEFAVVRPWNGWDDAKEFGEQLRQAISETTITDGPYTIQRTASIGVACLSKTGKMTEAMSFADMMTREAKDNGRDQVLLADAAALNDLETRGAFITTKEVQEGLDAGQFYYALQPIWNIENKTIEGFEALLRWERSDGRMMSPAQFAPVFDEVTRSADYQKKNYELRKAAIAALSEMPHAYISFNYQLERLADPQAAQEMIGRFDAIKDRPERVIMIELSEHAFTQRLDKAVIFDVLTRLRQGGFLIALDDFGVESSNINRLNEFPIDVVKIDKSLIDDVITSQNVRSLLRGMAMTMRNLKLRIIVEGVETMQQARMLRHYHLYSQQGYLHAKPMRPEDIAANRAQIGTDFTNIATIEEIRARTLRALNQ